VGSADARAVLEPLLPIVQGVQGADHSYALKTEIELAKPCTASERSRQHSRSCAASRSDWPFASLSLQHAVILLRHGKVVAASTPACLTIKR